jgi:GrpB-like predicted nucleotidyltransferase (UPF0157 family)
VNQGASILELCGHGLTLNCAIQVSESRFHVDNGFAAYGASVRTLGVLRKAFLVNTMPAAHEDNSVRRRKHIISTDWTVALSGALDTSMGVLYRDRQTHTTRLLLGQHLRRNTEPYLSIRRFLTLQ